MEAVNYQPTVGQYSGGMLPFKATAGQEVYVPADGYSQSLLHSFLLVAKLLAAEYTDLFLQPWLHALPQSCCPSLPQQ